VAARIETRSDSAPSIAARDRSLAELRSVDSVLDATRRALMPVPVTVIDTFPPAVRAQRDSLSAELATLNRLIDRAENAPLPTSYRALAASPSVAADPRVRALLDSLADIERERNAFGAVGGVDPVYLSLTSRATAIGRQIQGIADAKRGEVRGKLGFTERGVRGQDIAGVLFGERALLSIATQPDGVVATTLEGRATSLPSRMPARLFPFPRRRRATGGDFLVRASAVPLQSPIVRRTILSPHQCARILNG